MKDKREYYSEHNLPRSLVERFLKVCKKLPGAQCIDGVWHCPKPSYDKWAREWNAEFNAAASLFQSTDLKDFK
jgi:hypothetical protein